MPRFFLNVRDGDFLAKDPEGTVFADLDAAHAETLAAARDALSEAVKHDGAPDPRQFEITDEAGQVVATIPLMDVLKA